MVGAPEGALNRELVPLDRLPATTATSTGCVRHDASGTDATAAVNTAGQVATAGGTLFTPAEWAALAAHFRLTPRESQVARLVCAGCTQQAVAGELGLSINTVRMHLRSLFRRLNAHDRVSVLVRFLLAARALERDGTD